ncbi:unnamed protein product [Clonostachys rosea]|uniref:Protein kinase domain-containing protein n=1 Tax=Bionectria ochroleuca TaxID=29856 RepID=A0ABY6UD11_BIOOC|nr:unnamed protein product [Clonostachys rosea]
MEVLGGETVVAEYSAAEPRAECLPKHLVRATSWAGWFDCPEESIRLIDWGESFSSDEKVSDIAQPLYLRSPETFFVGSFDHRHDLWRAGCVIYRLFYHFPPFRNSVDKQDHINIMTRVMGPLPSAWQDQWIRMIREKPGFDPETGEEPYFQPLGKTFEQRRQFIITLAEKDENFQKPDFIEDDYQGLSCLLDVMQGLMQLEPQRRITSGEALTRMQWIDRWVSIEPENAKE